MNLGICQAVINTVHGWMGGLGVWIFDLIRHWCGMMYFTLVLLKQPLFWGRSPQHVAYIITLEARWGWHILLQKVHGVVMCQIWLVIFLLSSIHLLFSLKLRILRCLTHVECNNFDSKGHGENVDSLNSSNIFHQIIRRLWSKYNGFMNSFIIGGMNPHILCLSEHHMDEQALCNLTSASFSLGSGFCQ
jgi:hypothetical protein